jgi:hypothetical protein
VELIGLCIHPYGSFHVEFGAVGDEAVRAANESPWWLEGELLGC